MNAIWTDMYKGEFALKYKNINGINTRYVEAGEGETIIFLHGTGGHLEAFSKNITAHAEHFKVIALDMIGHGFTDKFYDKDYEIDVYVKHLLDFMDALEIDRASIHGESLGGWVAGFFASRYPERVNKLILNTAGGLSMYPEVMERGRKLSMEAVTNPSKEFVRERLNFLVLNKDDITDELVDIRYSIYKQPHMVQIMEKVLCLQIPEIRKKNMFTEEQLKAIEAPTCVIWTTHDPTAPKEVGEKFAALIPNAEFHLMENCAHWPQYEKHEEFNQLHIDFLKK